MKLIKWVAIGLGVAYIVGKVKIRRRGEAVTPASPVECWAEFGLDWPNLVTCLRGAAEGVGFVSVSDVAAEYDESGSPFDAPADTIQ